jgi:hypothetical protein
MATKKTKKEIEKIVKKKEKQVKAGVIIRKKAIRNHNGYTSPRK